MGNVYWAGTGCDSFFDVGAIFEACNLRPAFFRSGYSRRPDGAASGERLKQHFDLGSAGKTGKAWKKEVSDRTKM